MPLIKGKSKGAFEHNVKAEMHAGKPMKQSLAIAYAMKRKAKKSHGGEIESQHQEMMESPEHEAKESRELEAMEHDDIVSKIMHKRKMAMGGLVAEEQKERADNLSADYDYLSSGDLDDYSTNSGAADGDFLGDEREDHDRHDIVSIIMKKRKGQHNPRPA